MRRTVLLLLAVSPAITLAQGARPPATPMTATASVRSGWERVRGHVLAAAERVPEADYAYRPVETVRTMGQLFAHIAGSQHLFCAGALGEPMKPEFDVEKNVKSKAGII